MGFNNFQYFTKYRFIWSKYQILKGKITIIKLQLIGDSMMDFFSVNQLVLGAHCTGFLIETFGKIYTRAFNRTGLLKETLE